MAVILNVRAIGGNIVDAANDLPVINVGNVLTDQPDMFGGVNAMYFDGTNHLSVTSSQLDLGTGDFTIAFWANLKLAENINIDWRAFFGNYVSNGIVFWAYGKSSAPYSLSIGTSDYNRIDGYIIDGMWHHYALVRQKDKIYFYLDGRSRTIFDIQESYRIDFAGSIGIGWDLHYTRIKGYMSDFLIEDTALWQGNFEKPTSYHRSKMSLYVDGKNAVWGMRV